MPDDDFTDEQRELLEQLKADPWEVQQYRVGNLTDEELHHQAQLNLKRPIQSTPRQSGKSQAQAMRIKNRHSLYRLLSQVAGNGIVAWQSAGRFSYAAVYAGGKWYITGRGDFYGGNVFTEGEFLDVLLHPEVTFIGAALKLKTIWSDG